MLRIEGITAEAKQRHAVVLPDNTVFTILLVYKPLQLAWFIEEFVYKDFILRGVTVSNYPNILHQWRNILPFGIGCYTNSNREPTQQEDFESEASKLYVLEASEVDAYQEYLNGG